jgi:CO/xanthine dehydrogenase FAD-binding subunit
LICIERIDELRGIHEDEDTIFMAACTTHSHIIEHPLVRNCFPILAKALSTLASPPIRHMGTIGGNIVTASPAGDTLPALHVLGAEVETCSRNGSRRVPISEFIQAPGRVDLLRGELVRGVRIKKDPRWQIHHYEKVGRRKAQACAVASLAGLLNLSEDGIVLDCRFAWGSVGPTVLRIPEVESALAGRPLCRDVLDALRPLVERAVSPIDDIRASAAYRRVVAGALVLRLLEYRRDFALSRLRTTRDAL